jgi:hypothetical protein
VSDYSCRRRISARLGVGRWALRLNDLGGALAVGQVRGVGVLARLVGLRCYVAHFGLSFCGVWSWVGWLEVEVLEE